MISIIKITKEESYKMRERFPNVVIAITNRQSSHKKYYMEESSAVVKYLNQLRREEESKWKK